MSAAFVKVGRKDHEMALGSHRWAPLFDHRDASAAPDDREARYCEYRSQWTFPSSSPTLPIWTNSSSEHPRAHLSHCCFLPRSRAHTSAPANTSWPLCAFTPARMPSASLVLGSEVRCRQSSKCLQMFFGLLHAAWASGAAISRVASTRMPKTNGSLPWVIAISLCPNFPRVSRFTAGSAEFLARPFASGRCGYEASLRQLILRHRGSSSRDQLANWGRPWAQRFPKLAIHSIGVGARKKLAQLLANWPILTQSARC